MKTKKPPNPNPHETPRFASLLDAQNERKERGKGRKKQIIYRLLAGLLGVCLRNASLMLYRTWLGN